MSFNKSVFDKVANFWPQLIISKFCQCIYIINYVACYVLVHNVDSDVHFIPCMQSVFVKHSYVHITTFWKMFYYIARY